jgi:hypothetical protein
VISIKNQIANKLAKTEADREELRRSHKQVIEANSRLKNIFLLYDLYRGMGWDGIKLVFPWDDFFVPSHPEPWLIQSRTEKNSTGNHLNVSIKFILIIFQISALIFF